VQQIYGITFQQLYAWNTDIGSNCEDLWTDYAVCVSPPPGYSASTSATSSAPSAAPTRTGTASGCAVYHTVASNEGCWDLQQMYAITFDELYSWNTDIGTNCESLWTGYGVCVAGPVRAGTPSTCSQYYTVKSGDSCESIQQSYSISFSQLWAWNNDIGSSCEGLWLGYAVCVGGGPA